MIYPECFCCEIWLRWRFRLHTKPNMHKDVTISIVWLCENYFNKLNSEQTKCTTGEGKSIYVSTVDVLKDHRPKAEI